MDGKNEKIIFSHHSSSHGLNERLFSSDKRCSEFLITPEKVRTLTLNLLSSSNINLN